MNDESLESLVRKVAKELRQEMPDGHGDIRWPDAETHVRHHRIVDQMDSGRAAFKQRRDQIIDKIIGGVGIALAIAGVLFLWEAVIKNIIERVS